MTADWYERWLKFWKDHNQLCLWLKIVVVFLGYTKWFLKFVIIEWFRHKMDYFFKKYIDRKCFLFYLTRDTNIL